MARLAFLTETSLLPSGDGPQKGIFLKSRDYTLPVYAAPDYIRPSTRPGGGRTQRTRSKSPYWSSSKPTARAHCRSTSRTSGGSNFRPKTHDADKRKLLPDIHSGETVGSAGILKRSRDRRRSVVVTPISPLLTSRHAFLGGDESDGGEDTTTPAPSPPPPTEVGVDEGFVPHPPGILRRGTNDPPPATAPGQTPSTLPPDVETTTVYRSKSSGFQLLTLKNRSRLPPHVLQTLEANFYQIRTKYKRISREYRAQRKPEGVHEEAESAEEKEVLVDRPRQQVPTHPTCIYIYI